MKQVRFIVSCGGMYMARVYSPHRTIPNCVLVKDHALAWRFDRLEEARTIALEVMPDSQFTIVEVNA